jgi:hypothetical protein
MPSVNLRSRHKPKPVERVCLGITKWGKFCNRVFLSDGSRFCPDCQKRNESDPSPASRHVTMNRVSNNKARKR